MLEGVEYYALGGRGQEDLDSGLGGTEFETEVKLGLGSGDF